MPREEKQAAYNADVTYGTNNEYGFDYLRDNMVYETADRVQRGLPFAIVDEVDSILIDEARTPLIISGQAEDHTEMYVRINAVVPNSRSSSASGCRTAKRDGAVTSRSTKNPQGFLPKTATRTGKAFCARRPAGEGASLYDAEHHVMHTCRRNARGTSPRTSIRGKTAR